jgi:hypothetical protein
VIPGLPSSASPRAVSRSARDDGCLTAQRAYLPDVSVQAERSRACGGATAFLQAPARLATAVIIAPTTSTYHSEVPDRLT